MAFVVLSVVHIAGVYTAAGSDEHSRKQHPELPKLSVSDILRNLNLSYEELVSFRRCNEIPETLSAAVLCLLSG